jgi:hypothetical protein
MRAFNCSRSAVQSALPNELSPPKSHVRHLAVGAESDANVLACIQRQAQKNAPVTPTDIKNYCQEVCRLQVSRGWVASFIIRHAAELTEEKSSPYEKPRLQVLGIFRKQILLSMHETLKGHPADLVFNLDEGEISDWEDRKLKKAVVPIMVAAHDIHHRISRNVRHISIASCISASGTCLAPYVLTCRDSASFHRALEATRMPIGKHLILKQPVKLCVNADLFENYAQTVFLPHFAITRIIQNIHNEEVVRLVGNSSRHLTPLVIDLLPETPVQIVI